MERERMEGREIEGEGEWNKRERERMEQERERANGTRASAREWSKNGT
jgi:hypothetical protein